MSSPELMLVYVARVDMYKRSCAIVEHHLYFEVHCHMLTKADLRKRNLESGVRRGGIVVKIGDHGSRLRDGNNCQEVLLRVE